jgi:hypothetical protein
MARSVGGNLSSGGRKRVTRILPFCRWELASRCAGPSGCRGQQLQRTPADTELARFLHVSDKSLAEARGADMSFQPASLDAPVADGRGDSSGEFSDLIGEDGDGLEQVID